MNIRYSIKLLLLNANRFIKDQKGRSDTMSEVRTHEKLLKIKRNFTAKIVDRYNFSVGFDL